MRSDWGPLQAMSVGGVSHGIKPQVAPEAKGGAEVILGGAWPPRGAMLPA